MPSDDRTLLALAATAGPRSRFRAAVSQAADQVQSYLDQRRPRDGAGPRTALAELGDFAAGRIDASRFASLFDTERTLAPEPATVLQRAADVLGALHAAGDAPFVVDVAPDDDLRAAVQRALAGVGRAYAAALAFQAVRAGVYREEVHGAQLAGFPYARWNAYERDVAPPLVIEVDGAQLRAELLADLLDGQQKLVLVARGAVPGAPLVRLVTPDVLVMQTSEPSEPSALARVAAFDGPAIAALVPEGAARFVHDPDAGETLAERLRVDALPAEVPMSAAGGRSAWQQREEIAQLLVLGDLATAAASHAENGVDAQSAQHDGPSAAAPREPTVEALTRWLLVESGL